MLIPYLKRIFITVMLASMTTFVFAEDSAPVFDADNMPPPFDNQADMGPAPAAPPSPSATTEQQQAPYVPPVSTDQRLGRMEQQINNIQHSDSTAKITTLQSEVQALRGQVEDLTHQIQQLQNQQRQVYAEADKPKPITSNPAPAPAKVQTPAKPIKPTVAKKVETTPPVVVNQPNVAEEQQTYQTAYDLIKAKKYNDAIAALQKMLQKYPSGQFAANSHYWLGELYGLTGKNDESATEFTSIVKSFPDSPKVADAQLKLGMIYAGELKWPDAKTAFKKVINHYPGTASARLASEQLKQIKQAGH